MKLYLTVTMFSVLLVACASSISHSGSDLDSDPVTNVEKWSSCVKDEDCILVHHVCGGPDSINSDFEIEYGQFRNDNKKIFQCSGLQNPSWPKYSYSTCHEKACTWQKANKPIFSERFDSLGVTKKTRVLDLYDSAISLFHEGKVDECARELEILHNLVDHYQNSKFFSDLCNLRLNL